MHDSLHPGSFVRALQGERRSARRGGRRWSDHEPVAAWGMIARWALGIAALDWLTKFLVAATVPLNTMTEVVPNRLAFWHVRNRAMMLGLWEDLPLDARKTIAALAALLAVLVVFEIVGRGRRLPVHRRPWAWAYVGLSLGGMLGNLGERLVHWGVTDFLSFGLRGIWLPPGNVADLALFASFPLAVVVVVFELQARAQRRDEPATLPAVHAG